MEFPPGKIAAGLAADMDREGRGGRVKELLGVIVGKDDPQIGFECAQTLADVGGHFAHMRDQRLVLGVRHGEELGRMRQHGAADHGRHHGGSPFAAKLSRAKRNNKAIGRRTSRYVGVQVHRASGKKKTGFVMPALVAGIHVFTAP